MVKRKASAASAAADHHVVQPTLQAAFQQQWFKGVLQHELLDILLRSRSSSNAHAWMLRKVS